MAYTDPVIAGIHYFPLPDNFTPYRYEDEVKVVPLLGPRSGSRGPERGAPGERARAQVCTFAALAEGNAAKDALQALWATQTTHDLGDGAGARNVAVTKVDVALASWADPATPVYLVTLTTRTR